MTAINRAFGQLGEFSKHNAANSNGPGPSPYIGDPSVALGGPGSVTATKTVPVEYETVLDCHSDTTIDGVAGQIRMQAPNLKVADVKLRQTMSKVYDYPSPGDKPDYAELTGKQASAGVVTFDYGPFSILAAQHGRGLDEVTFADSAAAGVVEARTSLTKDSAPIAGRSWTYTVKEKTA